MGPIRQQGGWISPRGELFLCRQTHVLEIIACPHVFGVSRTDIEAAYAKHGERIGQEGQAREELIRAAVARGWIRFRRHEARAAYWSVTADTLDSATRDRITGLARLVLQGLSGAVEHAPDIPVRIFGVRHDCLVSCESVAAIADGALLETADPEPESLTVSAGLGVASRT
jgi:hypothetical protein